MKLLTISSLIVRLLWICGLWVLGLFRECWFMPMSVVELLACWQGQLGHHRNGYTWIVVPHCLIWCIWKERIVGALKIVSVLYLISSYYFLESYWTGYQCGRTSPFLQFWIYLIYVICIWSIHPCILPVYLGVSFFISINLYYYKKYIYIHTRLKDQWKVIALQNSWI